MDAIGQRLQCGWAGCPEEFDDEADWIRHVSIHVFTLKPNERTPWLGPPELDPDRQQASTADAPFPDDRSDDDDDDDHAFSQINALSSPASTPPQIGLPDSPDLSEKINDGPERALSHRTSTSADDVEAELIPISPTPSINASQNANQENSQNLHLLPHVSPVQTQSQFPSVSVNRFRRGTFQIRSPAQTSLRFGFGMSTPQGQGRLSASQTLLQSPGSSQVDAPSSQSQTNENGTSWLNLNTQAFRPPETQDSYESD
ncbi:hypothetical protein BDM02DRAFT_580795 [Thelephora ganbajun]|uniref:Uncharacterized protein n=1 Tax=Thelephora ganbajun TaxID=370292 RepID=A0ACB6Z744_THEGA|nr:hypothetical protein BDM02DRAFT_580795 [Thelephora ganbajun]